MKNMSCITRIRFVLSFFFVYGWVSLAIAQQAAPVADGQLFLEKCAATYIEQKQQDRLGIYGSREYFEVWLQDRKRDMRRNPHRFRTQANGKRQIPVVVHVIHNGTPEGEGANIPFSQIQAQIDILNQDYSRQNPDANNTPDEFANLAASANIEFVLAKQDPNGLPTNGVNRVAGSKSVYTPDDDALIGQLALWPPEEYMNIWVVPLQAPYLGYSAFPISEELPGLDFPPATRETDGVTIDYRMFGTGGNASNNSGGRTATHEIGHYFGLRHIWGDGGCDADDFVEDTPNQGMANNSCLTSPRFTCESRDMVENFMDYTPDRCMSLFTQGQVERMDVVLNFSPRRASLVNGRATQAPNLLANDLAVQAIVNPQDFICEPNVLPQITILNVGSNPVTSAQLAISLNGQNLQRRNFSVNLQPGEKTTLSFDRLTLPTGASNEFKVEITSVNGTTDSDLTNNTLITHPRIQPAITLPYAFKNNDFTSLWGRKNADGGVTWSRMNVAVDGQQQTLIYLNGFDYETQGELDYFISPRINLAGAPGAQLKFELAYGSYPNPDFQESLLVAVSTDCGNTFELLDAPYRKTGESLQTVASTSEKFIPDREQQFRTEIVDLGRYAGEGEIRIAFVSINGYGNNLYIKDIEILAQEQYRYELKVVQVVNPGPITSSEKDGERIEVINTGNLPVSNFMIRREAGNRSVDTFEVEDAALSPGASAVYDIDAGLSDGFTAVKYTVFNPNYDQNPGSSSTLTWHYIKDDSIVAVPWRQTFNDLNGIDPWIRINPEQDADSWELTALPEEGSNQVLTLSGTQRGNSYWFSSPLFDLSKTPQASVFFNWAGAGFRSTDHTSFSVVVSNDGGYSYQELWKRDDVELNTISGDGGSVRSSADFTRQFVDLSTFAGAGNDKVRIAFKVVHANGTSRPLYLDNIELFLSANPEPVDPGMGNATVYPNPAFDLFNVVFSLEEYEDVNIQVISSSGKVVHDVVYPQTLNQTYTFSTALFSKGVFIVKITGDKLSETKRLIIQ